MGDAAILQQPDHRGHAHGEARRVQEVAVLFFRHGHALEHQHDGAARGADVDGLIRCVQHQHRRMHHRAARLAVRAGGLHDHRRLGGVSGMSALAHKTYAEAAAIDWIGRAACPFSTRATVATKTRLAPARIRTRAHSLAVMPVVNTSSTTTIVWSATASLVTLKAPRTLARR